MKFTNTQLKFLNEHPEVFEKAEDPAELARKTGSFTAYHFNDDEIRVLVLSWAEFNNLVIVVGTVKEVQFKVKRLRLYLKGPIVNDDYLFLAVNIYDSLSQDQTIEAIRSRFESEYLFSLSDLPVLERRISHLIKR